MAIAVDQLAIALPLVILERPDVDVILRPSKLSNSVLFTIDKLPSVHAFILTTFIEVNFDSHAVLQVVLPLTPIKLTIGPLE